MSSRMMGWSLAVLLALAASSSACRQQPPYRRAVKLLDVAHERFKKDDLEGGLKALHDGLDALGDRYLSPGAADDTGLKLEMAKVTEAQGMLGAAYAKRRAVLEERVAMCEEKPGCKEAP